MNRKKTYISIVAILVLGLAVTRLSAQDLTLGVQYTIDKQSFDRQSDDFSIGKYSASKAGITVAFSPYYSHFEVASGISYSMNDLGTGLFIPLTFRLEVGKTLLPFAEVGAYYNYVLNDTEDDFILKNDLGVFTQLGLMVKLNKRWRLEIAYHYLFGVTPAIEEEILLPLNQVSLEQYLRKENGFALRVKYRF